MAIQLIKSGGAYVCHQTKTETARSRSLLREFQEKCAKSGVENRYEVELPEGAASPYRERSVEENLELFEKMRRDPLWLNRAHVTPTRSSSRSTPKVLVLMISAALAVAAKNVLPVGLVTTVLIG